MERREQREDRNRGVLKDAKYNDLREPAPATMYVSYMQRPLAVALYSKCARPAILWRQLAAFARRSGISIRTCR